MADHPVFSDAWDAVVWSFGHPGPVADAINLGLAEIRAMSGKVYALPPNVNVLLFWRRQGRMPLARAPMERMHRLIVDRTLDALAPKLRLAGVVLHAA